MGRIIAEATTGSRRIKKKSKHVPESCASDSKREGGRIGSGGLGAGSSGGNTCDPVAALQRLGDHTQVILKSRICYRWCTGKWCMGTVVAW